MEEAISWGLARARSVVIRTLGPAFCGAGLPPADWSPGDAGMRAWPPSQPERHQIDLDYAAAIQAAEKEEAAYRAYERQRDDWVRAHAPDLAGSSPVHEGVVVQPGPTGPRSSSRNSISKG